MTSKMYAKLVVLLLLVSTGAFAQSGKDYDPTDSSVVPSKRLPQHTEFMANNYAFPAKPRNQWELGIKLGAFGIAGDVRTAYPGIGAGLHVRKALGYVFSLRAEAGWGSGKGLNYTKSNSYIYNTPWQPYLTGGVATNPVIYNYKANVYDFTMQGVITLNNIRFHRAKTGFNIYGYGGLGGMIHDTKVDALDGSGTPYNFNNIDNGFYSDRKKLKKAVKDLLDGTYESKGEEDKLKPKLFGHPFRPLFVVGAGMQFKLNNKLSLSLENRYSIPMKTDLIDGLQWQTNSTTEPAQTRDYDTYNFTSLGLNIALGAKAVEPLWWVNPLDYAYNELNKPNHMKLPKPVLDDADGDGVTDQFDNEPNTPAGSPVDSHGVSRDTDGDGVPDSRDKELITPTQCQPVDADGVGKCPPPDCCRVLDSLMQYGVRGRCNIGDLPSITFKGRSVALSNDAKALITSVASKIRDNSECKIAVIGYCSSTKAEQQLSWDRVNAVINYLVEKEGISADRFIFKYGQEGGDCNTVDLRDGTQEEGPTTVPAPHPGLRRK
ncbi:MAG: OmpA family protein [Chitinophagaceae bacterium]|nr:OmpA family protein [Chitinophagaceae bacterium]